MATIEEVVKMWDETHSDRPEMQTETLKGKNVQSGGKIDSGYMYDRLDKWAVIKLADDCPFAKWNERICYVFDSKFDKLEINFQKRSLYSPCDTEKLYEFLDISFNGKEINGKKLTLARGRNPENLILKINFDKDSSVKEICDCMEEFIKLTRERICEFMKILEKITTIEEVVKTWNELNQENKAGEIERGSFYGRYGEEVVIKLSDDSGIFHIKSWSDRTCYVFSFNYDENNNPISIEISFQRRIKEAPNTQAFYEFLKNLLMEKKELKEFILSQGRINPNHLVLKRVFPPNSPEQDICDGMEELIKLTKESICGFVRGKPNERLLTESEKKIFHEIMEKHRIKEEDNLYGECEKFYKKTINILDNLYIGDDDINESFYPEVSYYTEKSTARNLLIPSKYKYDDGFRLYYTHGMNDPHEGKTLLSFLEIKDEDWELPKILPFIACFSLEVNSLNQFRLYGNDNGKEANGVSIVFNFTFLKARRIYRCVYIDPDKGEIKSISFKKEEEKSKKIEDRRKEIETLFIDLKNEIEVLLKKINNININKHELVKDLLINIRYLVKDYAFIEERECRTIDWRNKKDKSIKREGERLYIEIGEVKEHISEIYFAPCTEGIEVFEIKTGIKCTRSRHPYNSKRQ